MSRGRVYLLLGVLLAVISGVLVFMVVQSARSTKVQTRPVLVANQAIAPRTFVTTDNSKSLFAVANWPVNIVPAGTLTAPTQTVDHVVVGSLQKGSPVFETDLSTTTTGGQTGLSIDIPTNDVAISIPINQVNAVGGAISPGDYVDVLVSLTYDVKYLSVDNNGNVTNAPPPSTNGAAGSNSTPQDSKPQLLTLTTLQHVKVLAVGQDMNTAPPPAAKGSSAPANTTNASAPTLTLLLNHQDALLVKYAKDSGSTIDLVLRRYDDGATSKSDPVDLQYFLDHFGYHIVAQNQPNQPAAKK